MTHHDSASLDGLQEPLFWGSLALSLVVAALVAFPMVRWSYSAGVVTP